MFDFTPVQWVMIIAALTLPIYPLAIVYARWSRRRQTQWKHTIMILLLTMLPILLILGISGAFPWWVAATGFAVVLGFAFLQTDTND